MSEDLRYHVDLPTDFEPLESALLEVQQLGPELMESKLAPVLLTACRPGAIVIPGRRLWRSTVVTLGYQTADEISVLPNMNSPCSCGRDPGWITMPPANWGNACGTAFGVCRVNFAPIGSRCSCGRDPGQIIGR